VSDRGCIATPHHLATGVGGGVLEAGGNAVDAAVAAAVTLAVVAPYECGVGGDLFAIVASDGPIAAYNGSGRAPAGADPERVRRRAGSSRMPLFGADTVTVPGAVRGWFDLLERFGSRGFAELAAPAIDLAAAGFAPSERGAAAIRRAGAQSRSSAAWRAIYESAIAGGPLVQRDLGRLLGRLRDDGPDALYAGEVAAAIAAAVGAAGGCLEPADLAAHRGDWVDPVGQGFRGRRVWQLPPNSQGIAALQALAALDGEPLESMRPLERQPLLVEAARLAVAERDRFVADPDHMEVSPADLLATDRVDRLRGGLRSAPAGSAHAAADVGQTAYLCAADGDGLLVGLIQSNFLGFGSGITVPGWGINLHDRGAGFSLAAGHPNEAGGGKRPLHTLMPALVTEDGRPTHLLGTMGGTNQIAIQLQLLTAILVDGADLGEALARPRWALAEGRGILAERELLAPLAEAGAPVEEADGRAGAVGYAQALAATGIPLAAADPRGEGAAYGAG
jgi:gamma-glutamyltranspeptidase/glutathione hydrolase